MAVDKLGYELRVGDRIVGMYTKKKYQSNLRRSNTRGAATLEVGLVEHVYTEKADIFWVDKEETSRISGDRLFRIASLKLKGKKRNGTP